MDYSSLKSGTDIRGIASPLGGKEVNLTKDAIYDITVAFVLWYINKFEKKPYDLTIAVGHDSRITGENISETVQLALTNAGVTVLDCGLASTPAMFMTTVNIHTDAAIQITASHHPFDRNGLKFFTPNGGLNSDDISEITKIASNCEELSSKYKGVSVKLDFMEIYSAGLRRIICTSVGKSENDKPLSGYKIVVDAGNGAGGFYAEKVLKPLGANISGSQFLNPDGMFPNHIPNPENKEAMDSICKAVLENGADLGIIFDTDVDRAGCVGADGREINRNRLIALASCIAVNGQKNAVIVTDSVTSDGLKSFIEKDLGGRHYRYRRGYKNVINKAIELNEKGENCPLAIETSGHAALRENYFLDDGAYLVTKIITYLAKGIDINNLLSTLQEPVEEKEVRFKINTDDFKSYGLNVIEQFEKYCKTIKNYTIADDNREGLRVSTENGWFLLRMSVHDPVMPMNFESNVKGGIEKEIVNLRSFFLKFDKLDISELC